MNLELIRKKRNAALNRRLEKSRRIAQTHRTRRLARHQQIDAGRVGTKCAHHEAFAVEMRAENRMRIVMLQRQQTFQFVVGRTRRDDFSLHSKSEV